MANSYRTILKSSAIMGASSVVNVLVGLARMKAAAVLLGPAGVGLIGILQNLMGTASGIAALGFGSAGTRQVADAVAGGRADEVAVVRRALFWGTLALALVGGGTFFLLRDLLAARVLDDPERAGEIGWIAFGVALTVAAGSQRALLNGFRRIGDLARLQVFSGLASAIGGVLAILFWGEAGVVAFIVTAPLANFLLGQWFVARLERDGGHAAPLDRLAGQWRQMAQLGFAFMVSTLVISFGQLAARSIVQHRLGAEELGHFQAAWGISMTYLGFVLSAMATDYYPRLTAVIRDREAASRLVNEQTEVALLLGGPAVIAMIALAPLVIELLYSHEFAAAAEILRWQLLGDILKIASWPLGFVLVAAAAGRTYMMAETTAMAVFVSGIWFGLPFVGLQATGVSFLLMYVVYLPLVHWLARWRIGFSWSFQVVRQMAVVAMVAVAVTALAGLSETVAALAGCAGAAALGVYGLGRLGSMAELTGPVGRLASVSRRAGEAMGVRFG
jgi:PST family polysaccharide transporter